jgi:hypothetical protein
LCEIKKQAPIFCNRAGPKENWGLVFMLDDGCLRISWRGALRGSNLLEYTQKIVPLENGTLAKTLLIVQKSSRIDIKPQFVSSSS